MTMLMQIEEEIKGLHQKDFSKLREWFLDYEYQLWDKQIEEDIGSGKLDDLAQVALNDFKDNKHKAL